MTPLKEKTVSFAKAVSLHFSIPLVSPVAEFCPLQLFFAPSCQYSFTVLRDDRGIYRDSENVFFKLYLFKFYLNSTSIPILLSSFLHLGPNGGMDSFSSDRFA